MGYVAGLPQGTIQAHRGGDQGEVGEGVGEVAQGLSGGAYPFGAKSHVVGLGGLA